MKSTHFSHLEIDFVIFKADHQYGRQCGSEDYTVICIWTLSGYVDTVRQVNHQGTNTMPISPLRYP